MALWQNIPPDYFLEPMHPNWLFFMSLNHPAFSHTPLMKHTFHPLLLVGILVLSAAFAGATEEDLSDCVENLQRFIPAEVEWSGFVVKGVVTGTEYPFWMTEEQRIVQLTEQYHDTLEYQEDGPVEEFIAAMLLLIEEDEREDRKLPPRQWKVEIQASGSNFHIRHFDAMGRGICTQEVVMISVDQKPVYTTFNHVGRTITREIKSPTLLGFLCIHVILAPNRVRVPWVEVIPNILGAQGEERNIWEILCKEGSYGVDWSFYSYSLTGDRCVLRQSAQFPNGYKFMEEHELAAGTFPRLVRERTETDGRIEESRFEYARDDVSWPTQQTFVKTNMEWNHVESREVVQLLDVLPEEEINFPEILSSLLGQYSDYTLIENTE